MMSRRRTTMPKLTAETIDLEGTKVFLQTHDLDHLRARKRGDIIVIETADDAAVARLRRVSAQYWTLEMATHTGRWEWTPFRATRRELLNMLIEKFPWVLAK